MFTKINNIDGNEVRVVCPNPIHTSSDTNGSYNLATGEYKGFCNCQVAFSNVYDLKSWIERVTGEEIHLSFIPYKEVIKKTKHVDLDELFRLPLALDNNYLISRRVSNEIVYKYNIQWNPETKEIVVPIINENSKIVGYNIRKTDHKYYRQIGYKLPFMRMDFLENYSPEEPLYIVEGMFGEFNLSSYGLQVVSTLGSLRIPNNILIKFNVVCGCFDNDKSGKKYAERLLNNYPNTCVLQPAEFDEISLDDFKKLKRSNNTSYWD